MINFTIADAAAACHGTVSGNYAPDTKLACIVIDSRKVMPGDLFVAFKGEKVDGHAYIGTALDKGAACCLAERVPEGETRPVIVVPDVQEAVEQIAAAARNHVGIPIIGITGSVGKTSAKEMVSAVLSRRFRVLKTDGNLNNTIGVPMTLSRITEEDEIAVVEMGINHFGEMTHLGRMVHPDIAVYTVIGHAHLEFLGDLDGVFRAKTEMLPFMPENGTVIANGDDEKLKVMQPKQHLMLYGTGENSAVRAENITVTADGGTAMDIVAGERRIPVMIPAYGRHLVYAALEGAAAGLLLGLTDEEIAAGIASYHTVGRRAAVSETGFVRLIDDSYNANPDSVKCGIDSLSKLSGRKVAILGEMRELGENSPAMHRDVGAYAAERGTDLVVSCGAMGHELTDGAGEKGLWFETREALIAALPELLQRGDNVLVKASLTIGFDKVCEAIRSMQA